MPLWDHVDGMVSALELWLCWGDWRYGNNIIIVKYVTMYVCMLCASNTVIIFIASVYISFVLNVIYSTTQLIVNGT